MTCMRTRGSATLATFLAVLLPSSQTHAAAPTRLRVGLEIEASTLETFEEPLQRRLEYEIAKICTAEDIELVDEENPRDGTLRVTVEFREGSKIDFNYTVESSTTSSAGSDATPHDGTCERCMREGVVEKIVAVVPAELAELRESVAAEVAAVRPEAPASESRSPPARSDTGMAPKAETRQRLGAQGITGAALIGLGAAGLVTGAVLSARADQRTVRENDPQRFDETGTKPIGYAALGVGGAMVITGIVLLTLDRRRHRKSVTWTPTVGHKLVALSLGGSF